MRNLLVVLLLILLAAAGLFFFNKGDHIEEPVEQNQIKQTEKIVSSDDVEKIETDPQKLKLEKMQARYEELKEARKKMKMRLSRLGSRLRRSEFPPDQAQSISEDMRQANYRLKNPKLLGAFSDIGEIDQELEELSEINIRLDAIKQLLDEKRKNTP